VSVGTDDAHVVGPFALSGIHELTQGRRDALARLLLQRSYSGRSCGMALGRP
jgi:hypothetical protein